MMVRCGLSLGTVVGSSVFLFLAFLQFSPGTGHAEEAEPINIYRFVFGTDVPESPAIVTMGDIHSNVLKGSAPKPITLTTLISTNGPVSRVIGIDCVPYFLAGGGIRNLKSYRSNSIAGRLTRVLTKTSLSVASGGEFGGGGHSRLGLAIRATFHDPHDPFIGTALPESIEAQLTRAGVQQNVTRWDEDITDRGVNLDSAFASVSRFKRARTGMQVSGGFGQSLSAEGGIVSSDSLKTIENVYWLTSQITFGPRFDALITGQLRNGPDSDSAFRLGCGLLRKTNLADLTASVAYDFESRHLLGDVQVEIRALRTLHVVASVGTVPASQDHELTMISAWTGFRWFFAHD